MSAEDNLREAFAGESQANRKYVAFAVRAARDGYPQVAKLFRAVAQSETVHAIRHLKVLRELKSTEDNLKVAIAGENYEHTEMYPKFINEARKEGNKAAANSFDHANESEKVHDALFKKALDNLGQNERVDYFVCSVCGFTVENEPPGECPVCGARKDKFDKID